MCSFGICDCDEAGYVKIIGLETLREEDEWMDPRTRTWMICATKQRGVAGNMFHANSPHH